MKLEKSFLEAAREGRRMAGIRGSQRTWQQIELQAENLARSLHQQGYQIHDARQLKEKHIRAIFDKLKTEHAAGTLQNYARTARLVLRGAGKTLAADRLTNQALGLPERSRDGTKTACTLETLKEAKTRLSQNRDTDRAARLAAIIDLASYAGLRVQEALRAPPSFAAWLNTLEREGRIYVEFGTKGGRPRWVHISSDDRVFLREAIERAQALLVREKLWLVGKNLKASLDSLGKALRRLGFRGEQSFHSLRYSFARRQAQHYRESFSQAAAFAKVSRDLGHGDGRGRYVRQVYLR